MFRSPIRQFVQLESAGGILLVAASAIALLIENSNVSYLYNAFRDFPLGIQIGPLSITKPFLLWINDGMMAIFFMLVGLEIKREFISGELSRASQITLPAIAAIGGMVVPAFFYVFFNFGDPYALRGWAIPTATDIAFALGVLSLLGSRIPLSAKVLLTAIAIFDDLGAIIIIALFYTAELSVTSLWLASITIGVLYIMNRLRVMTISYYIIVGVVLWVCVLKSGIHATLAGVIVALMIPGHKEGSTSGSPLSRLEHSLHPWVTFLILPLFAFANAGVSFIGLDIKELLNPVSLGILMGLFIGKQLGIFLSIFITIKAGWAKMPSDTNWLMLYGVSILCGIGFTMSLFIGTLAFSDPTYAAYIRLGVLVGSLFSAIWGYFISQKASQQPRMNMRYS